jgi:superfamily I DNA/RNA helicase
MSENFRSHQAICDLANRLSAPLSCVSRMPVNIGGLVECHHYDDSTAEMVQVCQVAKDWNQSGADTAAILLRTNALVDAYAAQLRGIGVQVQTRQEPIRTTDWQTCLALLNCMARPQNDRLCIMFIARSRGQKLANEIAMSALQQQKTVNEISLHLPLQADFTAEGYLTMVIPTLKRFAVSLESQALIIDALHDEVSISIQDMLMRLQERGPRDQGEGVAVLTIHGSKGKEFDTVFLPHLVQGTMPSSRSKTPDQIAEDRRLCYVAVTRAKRVLHLSYHDLTITPYGTTQDATPSMFLREMGLV